MTLMEPHLVAILENAFSLVSMAGSFPLVGIRCKASMSKLTRSASYHSGVQSTATLCGVLCSAHWGIWHAVLPTAQRQICVYTHMLPSHRGL